MRRRLTQATFPGSAALRTFESAGRQLSFQRAAKELNVTESAVSFQIRQLEKELGAELFERRHRQVKLTPAGRSYLAVVQQAHRSLMNATLSLAGTEKPQLRVSALPAFAEHWLAPRLPMLAKAAPEIAVSIFVSSDLVDLDRDEIDVAIRYGTGTWPRTESEHLMDETVLPVAHPKLARRLAKDAAGVPLVVNLQHPDEWTPWLSEIAGAREPSATIRLEGSSLVLRAATEQLGIAIGRRPFVDDLLARGALVPLADREIATGKGYFILTPVGRVKSRPELASFVAALHQLAARSAMTKKS
jgi:LysR family transcriptional regulator, glycine cleavage system transcriptional activator